MNRTRKKSPVRPGTKPAAQSRTAGIKPGRNATINGPTIDFRTFASGRGVTTNFIGTASDVLFDDPDFVAAFGLQFDTPAGFAGQPPFPGAEPTEATGWTGTLPASLRTSLPPSTSVSCACWHCCRRSYGPATRTTRARLAFDRLVAQESPVARSTH